MISKWKLFVYLALISLMSAIFFPSAPTAAEKKDSDSSISITSESLDLNEAKNTIIFEGSVLADTGDSIVKCDRMEIFYIKDSSNAQKAGVQDDGRTIDRILCLGNVNITRSDGTQATAHKAEMFQTDEILILSGKAVAFQGKNRVEGDVITLYLKEKRTVVKSSESSRVKAVVFRDSEKK